MAGDHMGSPLRKAVYRRLGGWRKVLENDDDLIRQRFALPPSTGLPAPSR